MAPLTLQGITATPAAPAAPRTTGAPGELTSGTRAPTFASLLHALEHAGSSPATPEQLGTTLATAEDAFELAMRLRIQLEHAYSRRES